MPEFVALRDVTSPRVTNNQDKGPAMDGQCVTLADGRHIYKPVAPKEETMVFNLSRHNGNNTGRVIHQILITTSRDIFIVITKIQV